MILHGILPRALVCIAVAWARFAGAQGQPDPPAFGAGITGSVIDATTGTPLARASVTLTVADGSGLLSGRSAPALTLARTTATSATGIYRFADLPIGVYRLYVQRIGYAPATVEVRLGDTGTSPLSIGLVVVPVRLRAVEIRAIDRDSFTDDYGDTIGNERVAEVRARQRAFLSTDVRELTASDVAESVTLGGNDVLRSLQRLPGVTQLDDWSAKLSVRGDRWDHARVYYDDLPLFDPLQALGRTTGVTADAIGGAFLHPGVRPVSLGGEGAARIDLRSRPAGGADAWRSSAELSQFGATASVEHARADASAGFGVSAHHTLGDWLPRGLVLDNGLDGRSFSDEQVTVRGDVDAGQGRRFETSALLSRDARRFRTAFGDYRTDQDWGNAAARLTFRSPVGPFATSHTVGLSHFSSSSDRTFVQVPTDVSPTLDNSIRPVVSSVDYLTLAGRLASRSPSRDEFATGYEVTMQRSSFAGPRSAIFWGDLSLEDVARRDALAYASVWGDRRMEVGERVMIEAGLRLDAGGSSKLGAVRPAASAQARFAVSPRTWVSAGASRTHQYVQGIDLPVVAQGRTAPALWLTSGSDVPVMSVDNAMAGVEHFMGAGVLLAANAYVRHTTGAITADPAPGPLTQRPLFVEATESARGVELSARKLTGRTTGFLAYSYGKATTQAEGRTFASPASRTHALDAAMAARFGSFRLDGAYALTSGAPYSRTFIAGTEPSGTGVSSPYFEREAPNALRLPAYSSLDVSLDYTRTVHGTSLTVFGALHNILGRKNLTWYQISGVCDDGQTQPTRAPQCRGHDLIDAPVKLDRTVGLRILF